MAHLPTRMIADDEISLNISKYITMLNSRLESTVGVSDANSTFKVLIFPLHFSANFSTKVPTSNHLRLGKNAVIFKDAFYLPKKKCTNGHNIHDTLVNGHEDLHQS